MPNILYKFLKMMNILYKLFEKTSRVYNVPNSTKIDKPGDIARIRPQFFQKEKEKRKKLSLLKSGFEQLNSSRYATSTTVSEPLMHMA